MAPNGWHVETISSRLGKQKLHEVLNVFMQQLRLDDAQVVVEPLGLQDLPEPPGAASPAGNDGPEVLFVGRFELRKGIDTLFAAIPQVLAQVPQARARLVGDCTLPGPGGLSFQEAFFASPEGAACAPRVRVDGLVDIGVGHHHHVVLGAAQQIGRAHV